MKSRELIHGDLINYTPFEIVEEWGSVGSIFIINNNTYSRPSNSSVQMLKLSQVALHVSNSTRNLRSINVDASEDIMGQASPLNIVLGALAH